MLNKADTRRQAHYDSTYMRNVGKSIESEAGMARCLMSRAFLTGMLKKSLKMDNDGGYTILNIQHLMLKMGQDLSLTTEPM